MTSKTLFQKLLAFGFIATSAVSWAQNGNSQVDVNQDVKHDISPPFRDIIAPPSDFQAQHQKRIGRTNAQFASGQGDPVIQSSTEARVAPTTAGLNFDGVGVGFTGPNGTFTPNAAPPDTNGAVGATQYVQWVNSAFAVFNKSTGVAVMGPTLGSALWAGFGGGCQNNNDGDPVAQYDKAANRWVLTQFSVTTTPFLQCVAVSTTSDATGTYFRYAFTQPDFNDYPKLSVWPDAYYATFNMFAGGVTFTGARVCAMDRAKMLIGAAATQVCFQQSTAVDSLLPADVDGSTPPPAGSPNFLVNFATNSLQLFKFHVDFTTPANSTFTGPTVIPVAAFSPACGGATCIPQSGTTQQLDSLADRLMYRLAYRNFGDHEALAVNHSVTAGSSVGIRWYEIRNPNGAPTVFQQGTFAPDATFRWMGSIGMDRAGDIAVGYSASSSSIFPSIRLTGRTPADPVGTLQPETIIQAGGGNQNGGLNRWGDYSALTIDPVDDCTFWYTNQYQKATGSFNWSTRIANFKFATCGAGPDFAISASPASQTVIQGAGTSYTATVTPSGGFAGAVTFSVSGLPAGAAATFAPTSVAGSGSSTMSVTTSASTPTGTFTLTITGASGALVHSTTVTLVVNPAPTPDFSISAAPASQTVVRGSGTSYTATVTPSNGFSGTVTFSASGLPAGAAATFAPTSVAGSGSSTMSVTTSATTPTGTFTLTITGASGALVHSTTVTLVVNPAPTPDFSISATPASQTVVRGSGTSYAATVTPSNGFTGTVTFSASGLPAGAAATFAPTSVVGSGSSTMSVTTSATTPTGTFTLTITGASGALVHSTTVTLVVNAPADFSLSATPASQTVTAGASTSYTVNITRTGGFTGGVTFSVSGLPSGAAGTFSPNPSTGASSALSVTTSVTTPPGTYPLTITGVSGALTHTTSATLVVTAPTAGDFSLSVTPTSRTVPASNSTTYTVNIARTGGFTGAVTMSVTGLPTGASATFSPNPATGASSTLTITTLSSTPTGTFALTIKGVSGALTHTTSATLVMTGCDGNCP